MSLFNSVASGLTSGLSANPVGVGKGIVGIASAATNFVGNIAQQQGKNTATIAGLAGAVTLPMPKSVNNFLGVLASKNPNSPLLQNFSNYMTPQQGTSFLQGGFNANVSGAAGTPGSPITNRTNIVSGIFDFLFSPIGLLIVLALLIWQPWKKKR